MGFVATENGTLHFCLDYLELNAVTKRDLHQTAGMDECINSLGKTVGFFKLDANSEY